MQTFAHLRLYDTNYRVNDIVSPALEWHFVRDATGNITGVSEAGAGSESYRYDPLYRLASVDDPTGQAIEAYTYNKTGDRLSKTGNGLATGIYGYQPGTHWLTSIGTASRTYDANGNTTGNAFAGDAWGYGYNGRNRMTVVQRNGVTVGTYVYNSLEQRVAKTAEATATRFAYSEDSQLLTEQSESSTRDYLWLDDIPLAALDGGTSRLLAYMHADALGTPRAATSENGAILWRWPYLGNPFGEVKPSSAAAYVLNLRYAGQYFDEEAKTVHNINRDYDAPVGRYMQSDPTGLYAGLSTYSYTDSSPFMYFDFLGLSKGGKRDLSTEGFNKRSNPKDVQDALEEAIKLGQKERIKSLRALLKVIKRGGTMAEGMLPLWITNGVLREQCIDGDSFSCMTYCQINADECEEIRNENCI